MTSIKPALRRCAIYTRKSSEEGLDQDFNSLHAQREACEAFIRSQKGEGWQVVPAAYDDGGFSGGTMERPGLQRLLADIRASKIDIVVVYKVDRLTRALSDFAKMVEDFDGHGVSFVAVTQQFNTTTSMGRLTLNVLLSFAQFEREVTSERIRDKIAASKKKGMWMGGTVPLGYDAKDRKLVINPAEAKVVQLIYQRYLELGCVRRLKTDIDERKILSKQRTAANGRQSGGAHLSRGALYTLLANRIYVGEIGHKEDSYAGQHKAIIERPIWSAVQQQLTRGSAPSRRRATTLGKNLLSGKLFDEAGEPLVASHTIKNGRQYRYYVSRRLTTASVSETSRGWRLPAAQIEQAVIDGMVQILSNPAQVTKAWRKQGLPLRQLPPALVSAKQLAEQLRFPVSALKICLKLLRKVVICDESILLSLGQIGSLDETKDTNEVAPFEHSVSLKLKRRGSEIRIIVDDGKATTKTGYDPALFKAIARARCWFDELTCDQKSSIRKIATREGITKAYAARLLPLAFLAVPIVETIFEGKQPFSMTSETLTRKTNLSLDWAQQVRILQSIC